MVKASGIKKKTKSVKTDKFSHQNNLLAFQRARGAGNKHGLLGASFRRKKRHRFATTIPPKLLRKTKISKSLKKRNFKSKNSKKN